MAISESATGPAVVSTMTATTLTTASYTPAAQGLIVAMVATDGVSGTAVTTSVTDSGSHTWTLLARSNNAVSNGGCAEVWCLWTGANGIGSITTTATQSGGTANGMRLSIRVLLGTGTDVGQNGATGTTGGSNVTPTVTITTTVPGSYVYGTAVDFSTNASQTMNANTTLIGQTGDATNLKEYISFKASAATGTPGSTTFGFTNASAAYNIAVAEILPAPNPAPPLIVSQAVARASLF